MVVALTGVSGGGHAQDLGARAPGGAKFALSYTAPAACPAESEFESGVVARAPHARRIAVAAREVRVRVDAAEGAQGAAVYGEVEVLNAGEASMRRTVDGVVCADVTSALAFIVALSLEEAPPRARSADTSANHGAIPSRPQRVAVRAAVPSRWRSALLLAGGVTTDVVRDPAPLGTLAYEGRLERGGSVFAPCVEVALSFASGSGWA